MALRPNVPYDAAPSIAPETGMPDDYLHVQATPAAFGGQVAAATGQFGGAVEKVGQAATDTATEQIGIINQVAASDAYNASAAARGDIIGKYKSLQGLDAVAAKTDTINQLQALRQKTIESLPTVGAQRAYGMLSARQDAYALQDVEGYAALQLKQAQLNSSRAGVGVAIGQAGDLSVAQDNMRFGESLGDIKFHNYQMMEVQGYGSVMHTDQNGNVTFDATPQGQQAQTVYQNLNNEALGKAWETRIQSLADDPVHGNVNTAFSVFNANRANIPSQAQAQIAAYLMPKVRASEATSIGTNAVSRVDTDYGNYVEQRIQTEPITMRPNADVISAAISGVESSYGANPSTSVAGARGTYQITQALFDQYAQPGESFDSRADQDTVARRALADYSARYGNDPARVAVAWFSGPNNVAPAGSPTPWINDTHDAYGMSVSGYVGNVLGRLGGAGPIPTKADYYRTNYATILDDVRQQATTLHPDDPTFADQAVARATQQIGHVIQQQDMSNRADSDLVYKAFSGGLSGGTTPTSVAAMVAISPEVKAAWDRLNAANPLEANLIENRILTAANKANPDQRTYGAGFYNVFQRIHAAPGDPNRISNMMQLYSLVDAPDGLTMAGLKAARAELQQAGTPDGAAEAKMRGQLFKTAHTELTAGNPIFHTKDPKGEEIFSHFMAMAYQQIAEDKDKGLTAQQIYDPASPSYVGKMITSLKRTPEQINSDLFSANAPGGASGNLPMAPADVGGNGQSYNLKTRDGIFAAYDAGQFGTGAAAVAKAKELLIGAGLASPQVAAPTGPTVPLH